MLKDTLESRCIDKPDTAIALYGRHLDPHNGHLLDVAGILLFSNESVHMLHRNQLAAAVQKPDLCAVFGTILNFNHGSRNWNDAHGQDRTADEAVQETALARLKTAEDSDVEDFFLFEGPAALNKVI